MKCFVCSKGSVGERLAQIEGKIRKEKYTVEIVALVCNTCGHVALEGRAMPEFMRLLADAYRRAHNLLTSDEIKHLRHQLGMSQQRFAEALAVGLASVKRWELGMVQDKRNNRLILDLASRAEQRWVTEELGRPVCEQPYHRSVEAGLEGLPHGPPSLISWMGHF